MWTNEAPTQQGWYWCKTDGKEAKIVELYLSPIEDKMVIYFAGVDFATTVEAWLGNHRAEWCGPLIPPP